MAHGGLSYTASLARVTPQQSAPPTYEELGPLDIAGGGGLSWSESHNREEEGTVVVHPEALPASLKTILRQLFTADPANIPWLELWITGSTSPAAVRPVHRGRVIMPQFVQSPDGLTLVLHSRGPLYETRSMWVTTRLAYTATDQFAIVADLIDQWQDQDYGHLGIDTSSVGTSGQTRQIVYDPIEEHNVYTRIEELAARINGFDYWVDLATGPEARVLTLGTRGTDLTDTVVLDRRGLVNTGLAVSLTADDLASEAFGVSSPTTGPLSSTFGNASLRQAIGRRGVSSSFHNVEVQATLDDYTEQLQTTRSLPLITPQPELIPVSGADEVSFGAGDIVQFVPSLGIDTAAERIVLNRRVMTKRVVVGDDGNVTIGVEFF